MLSITKRSSPSAPDPDLFIFAVAGYFKGYYPGYSAESAADQRHLTWAILKGHTKNRAGTVTLRSRNPLDTPHINFRYFGDSREAMTEENRSDLDAVVSGIKFVREINAYTNAFSFFGESFDFGETLPGSGAASDEALRDYVKKEAWGHHASCTCPIGEVVDGHFKVRGTTNLRVVDASVFPEIPGFFIVMPIYMISEKATDVILRAAGRTERKDLVGRADVADLIPLPPLDRV